jgi:hypothetical protein
VGKIAMDMRFESENTLGMGFDLGMLMFASLARYPERPENGQIKN